MKKIIIILVALLVISISFLSGCDELSGDGDVSGDTSKVELLNYDVKTKWITGVWTLDRQEHETTGFYHGYTDDASSIAYIITGNIRNKAGYKLEMVEVTAKLYDKNNNFLDSSNDMVYGTPDNYEDNFTISFYESSTDGFEDVDSVKFELKEG